MGVVRAGSRASCSWCISQGADLPGLSWVREHGIDSKCCVSLREVFEYRFLPRWTPGSEKFCKTICVGSPFDMLVVALTQGDALRVAEKSMKGRNGDILTQVQEGKKLL